MKNRNLLKVIYLAYSVFTQLMLFSAQYSVCIGVCTSKKESSTTTMFLTLVSAALNSSQAWDICTIFSFIWKAQLSLIIFRRQIAFYTIIFGTKIQIFDALKWCILYYLHFSDTFWSVKCQITSVILGLFLKKIRTFIRSNISFILGVHFRILQKSIFCNAWSKFWVEKF